MHFIQMPFNNNKTKLYIANKETAILSLMQVKQTGNRNCLVWDFKFIDKFHTSLQKRNEIIYRWKE